MSRVASAATTALVAGALLGACSSVPGETPPAGRLEVVASFYPLAEAAERVGGELVSVRTLTPPGVEPHDLELTPDDLEAIVTADLVLYLGGGFQPAVEDAVEQAGGAVVDALEGQQTRPGDGELVADPHVWLDPARYRKIVERIVEVLAGLAPEREEAFQENASAFGEELRALDAELRAGLSSCRTRTIVVSHGAFGYLADAYGLVEESIAGISPEAEPDPARLAELKDLVEREGITTIFAEELVSPAVAETLAREAGVRVEVLDPIEGLSSERIAAGEGYVSIMRENLQMLRRALGCSG